MGAEHEADVGAERARLLSMLISALSLSLSLMASAGCRDREQQARASGEAARAEVARSCAAQDGGAAELAGECAARACDLACAPHAGARVFHRACVDACVAQGECVTDASCAPGLRCVAIAPRVRRCEPGGAAVHPPR